MKTIDAYFLKFSLRSVYHDFFSQYVQLFILYSTPAFNWAIYHAAPMCDLGITERYFFPPLLSWFSTERVDYDFWLHFRINFLGSRINLLTDGVEDSFSLKPTHTNSDLLIFISSPFGDIFSAVFRNIVSMPAKLQGTILRCMGSSNSNDDLRVNILFGYEISETSNISKMRQHSMQSILNYVWCCITTIETTVFW